MRLQLPRLKSKPTSEPTDVSSSQTENAGRRVAQSTDGSGLEPLPAGDSGSASLSESADRISRDRSTQLTGAGFDEVSKYRAIIKHLYARLVANQWLVRSTDSESDCYGLFIRKGRGAYISEPGQTSPVLLAAVEKINMEVTFTMATETTRTIISSLSPLQEKLALPDGSQVQIYPSLSYLALLPSSAIRKFQYAALIVEERLLLVWHDKLDTILTHSATIEAKLLTLICTVPHRSTNSTSDLPSPLRWPTTGSSLISPAQSAFQLVPERKIETTNTSYQQLEAISEEQTNPAEWLDRPRSLTSSVFVGMGMCLLIILVIGFGVANVILEIRTDGNCVRAALLATIPIFMLFSTFFVIVIFGDIFQVLGPIKRLRKNTCFYSALRPNLAYAYAQGFRPPRITIQMPVYTESLAAVIIPTVTSLKEAIAHYEYHRGSATIFINDDGLAYMSEEEQQERINFYRDNSIAYVARPKHNDESGYVRKGKFKKASNMNFALNVSNKVDDKLYEMLEGTSEKPIMIDAVEEEIYYREALTQVLESDPRVRAEGDIRIGEYILIVDSDTRVPHDCLLYGAAEMFLSPEVAIIQHSTGVMQVAWDYFENGITFFTNLIYSAIRFSVGSGEVAPFVGHNAFLRWRAVQSVAQVDEDGYTTFWSESHVSEDFDIALRLQIAGDIVRLATYHNDEFKEGVSLTIYDELTRWEKYAYGCNELVFNPVHTWLWKGPCTKLFMKFLTSNLQLSSRITILGYISSYYALASGFPLTIMNYFLVGWFNGYIDKYYIESWKILLSVLLVFAILGNVCLAIMRYRIGEKSLGSALLENFKWLPMFLIFFGGLSFHLSRALLAHMFNVNMRWTTTAKEKVSSNFFREVPKLFRRFKWMYATVIPMIGVMIYLGCFAPHGWMITQAIAIVPMAFTLIEHSLLPLALNPSLMVFNY